MHLEHDFPLCHDSGFWFCICCICNLIREFTIIRTMIFPTINILLTLYVNLYVDSYLSTSVPKIDNKNRENHTESCWEHQFYEFIGHHFMFACCVTVDNISIESQWWRWLDFDLSHGSFKNWTLFKRMVLALTEILTVSGRFPKRMLWVRLQKYLVHSEINGKQIKLKLIYYSTELKIRLWVLAMQMQITTWMFLSMQCWREREIESKRISSERYHSRENIGTISLPFL